MAGAKDFNKINNLHIRISDSDIIDLEYICRERDMTKSEMIVYLIRREADKVRDRSEK